MNSKAMALLAVVVMIASGAVAFVSMPSEVEAAGDGSINSPYDLGTVYVDGSATTSVSAPVVDVKYNQSAYTGLPYKATLSAYVTTTADSNTNFTPIYTVTSESGTPTITGDTVGALKFTAKNDTNGIIAVTVDHKEVENGGDATPSSNTVKFRLDMVINPGTDSSELELEPVYYKLNVTVRTNGSMTMTATDDATYAAGVYFTVNRDTEVQYTATLSGSSDAMDYDSYVWYAYGLPAGLSIYAKEDGVYIGGMPIEESTADIDVKVVAREISSGLEYTATVSFTVEEAETVSITVKRGDDILKPTADNEYYVLTNGEDAITLEVGSATAPTVSAIKYDTDLSRVNLPTTSPSAPFTYTIPVDGAGTYYIEVSSGAGVEILKINVAINPTGAAGAGFEIVSTPSSP